jgi:predicted transcriptional regulator
VILLLIVAALKLRPLPTVVFCSTAGSLCALPLQRDSGRSLAVTEEVVVSKFGELEAAVMDRMWNTDAARSVRDVMEELQRERTVAYTTVMTVMERLFRKGMLTRVEDGRAYFYSPAQSRADYTAGLMADTLASSTDKAATLVHFADRVSAGEAKQLIKALADRSARRGR